MTDISQYKDTLLKLIENTIQGMNLEKYDKSGKLKTIEKYDVVRSISIIGEDLGTAIENSFKRLIAEKTYVTFESRTVALIQVMLFAQKLGGVFGNTNRSLVGEKIEISYDVFTFVGVPLEKIIDEIKNSKLDIKIFKVEIK